MFGKLLYDEPKPIPVALFVTLMGASTEIDDDGKIIGYVPRGEIVVNVGLINAVYDHTILTGGHKIRVMETLEEIRRKIRGR
jgi:hypothetical protein